jgi:chitin synthase
LCNIDSRAYLAGDNESIGEIIEASKQQQAQEAASAYGLPYGAASVHGGGGGYDTSPFRSGEFAPNAGYAPSVAALSQHEMMSLQGYQPPMTMMGGGNKRESTTSFFAANAIRQAAQMQQQQQQPRYSTYSQSPHDQLFGGGNAAGGGGGLPSDEQLAHDVQELLSTADLTQVTKKRVREALEERYGVALPVEKKALVNQVIAQVLGLDG